MNIVVLIILSIFVGACTGLSLTVFLFARAESDKEKTGEEYEEITIKVKR